MGPNYDIQIHHLCKLESLVEKFQYCYFAQPNHNSALPLYKLTNGRTTMVDSSIYSPMSPLYLSNMTVIVHVHHMQFSRYQTSKLLVDIMSSFYKCIAL